VLLSAIRGWRIYAGVLVRHGHAFFFYATQPVHLFKLWYYFLSHTTKWWRRAMWNVVLNSFMISIGTFKLRILYRESRSLLILFGDIIFTYISLLHVLVTSLLVFGSLVIVHEGLRSFHECFRTAAFIQIHCGGSWFKINNAVILMFINQHRLNLSSLSVISFRIEVLVLYIVGPAWFADSSLFNIQ